MDTERLQQKKYGDREKLTTCGAICGLNNESTAVQHQHQPKSRHRMGKKTRQQARLFIPPLCDTLGTRTKVVTGSI